MLFNTNVHFIQTARKQYATFFHDLGLQYSGYYAGHTKIFSMIWTLKLVGWSLWQPFYIFSYLFYYHSQNNSTRKLLVLLTLLGSIPCAANPICWFWDSMFSEKERSLVWIVHTWYDCHNFSYACFGPYTIPESFWNLHRSLLHLSQ